MKKIKLKFCVADEDLTCFFEATIILCYRLYFFFEYFLKCQ